MTKKDAKLVVLFNHSLTAAQKEAAHDELGVADILVAPAEIGALWQQIPAEIGELAEYLQPVCCWLKETCRAGDFLLVQGDFGATVFIVSHALRHGWQPVYSTTRRQAAEIHGPDGRVELRHSFQHVRFRRYRLQQ